MVKDVQVGALRRKRMEGRTQEAAATAAKCPGYIEGLGGTLLPDVVWRRIREMKQARFRGRFTLVFHDGHVIATETAVKESVGTVADTRRRCRVGC